MEKGKSKRGSTVMVTPHPTGGPLRPINELAAEAGLKNWELSGMARAAGWAPGKQVTAADFDGALSRFRTRPQGGGRI